ncbi:NUDIX domain-containing protein [Candidatus Saccharibacteria bacterium]|nr:NUDIX domain-containing protein [Candidatus Saccharibacteria bacterium]
MKLQVGVKSLIKKDDAYLFLRRSRSFGEGQQDWDIPGGRIEPEESLDAALTREVYEETGLQLNTIGTLIAAQDIFVTTKDLHVVRLTYASSATGTVTISDEHSEYVWMTKKQVLSEQHVDKYLRHVLEGVV